MDFRLEQPLWLWLLAAAIPLTLLGARWLLAMSPTRRASAVLARGALIALLAAMLAGLSNVHRTNVLAVIGVVDVSGSVRRFYRGPTSESAADAAKKFLAGATRNRGPDDLVGVVAFDGRSIVMSRAGRAKDALPDLDVHVADGTNIAEALRLARSMIPPDAAGRIVLLSDGIQTSGDVLAAASESAGAAPGRAVPIDVAPFAYELGDEIIVEALDAPPTAAMGASINLRVAISSTRAATGTLRLIREEEPVDLDPDSGSTGRRVALNPGLNVETIEVRLDRGRVHRFRAIFEPDVLDDGNGGTVTADSISENNRAEAFTVTPGRGSVLLVDGVSQGDPRGSGATLAGVLRESGSEVSIVAPGGLPPDLLSLQAYDLVILENVAAESVPETTQAMLRTYVEDLGGGLVVIGGPDSYAPGGWQGTPIEPILPVALDLPDVVMAPQAATIMVLDNSGSMWKLVLGTGRSQQEIANDAAALAIRSLDKRDLLGIITFNNQHDVLVPLAKNDNAAATISTVRAIGSGGGTNVIPALEAAREEMKRAAGGVKLKHIVVLSDGVSRGKDRIAALAEQLKAEGVRISTVAVGDDADLGTMRRMAELGGGEYFHAASATTLPRLLLKAVRLVRTPLIREDPFEPVVLPSGSPITAGLTPPLPQLNGLVLTRPRPEPTITLAIATPKGEPVLAHWSVGLGQVAAWTSDASDWVQPWLATDTFARLWTQLARTIARAPESRGLRAESEATGEAITLRLAAADDQGVPLSDLSVTGTLYHPGGRQSPVTLTQVGPGVYEAKAPTAETGSYIAVLKPTQNGRPLAPVIVGSSITEGAEYRARKSDSAVLAEIAARTGGRVLDLANPAAANLFNRDGITPREAITPVWRSLLIWTIAMLLLDIATRRVAWDRWFSRRFAADSRAQAEADRLRSQSAVATAGALRERSHREATEIPAIALGEQDAQLLAEAARDRRRAQRLDALRADTSAPIVTATPTPEPENSEGGLLAAKRRAREKMERED